MRSNLSGRQVQGWTKLSYGNRRFPGLDPRKATWEDLWNKAKGGAKGRDSCEPVLAAGDAGKVVAEAYAAGLTFEEEMKAKAFDRWGWELNDAVFGGDSVPAGIADPKRSDSEIFGPIC